MSDFTKENFNINLKLEIIEKVTKSKIGLDLLFFLYLKEFSVIKNNIFLIKPRPLLTDVIIEYLKNEDIVFKVVETKINGIKSISKIEISNYFVIEKNMSNFLENNRIEEISKNYPNLLISVFFLLKGYINDLNSKFYHLELRLTSEKYLKIVKKIFTKIGVISKEIYKKNVYYIYIKKSSYISDILKFMEATKSVFLFEDTRIERDFSSYYKKLQSIDNYNYQRTSIASNEQREAIEILINNGTFNKLSKNKQQIAQLRISEANLSLSDLTNKFNQKYNTNFSKSAINHWLREITKLAK